MTATKTRVTSFYVASPFRRGRVGHINTMYKLKQDTVFHVEQDAQLLDFLLSKMGGMTKTSVKQLLGQRRVSVNGSIQTRHDTPLHKGDKVVLVSGRGNIELTHPKLSIVYEDDSLIVVEKKQGLLTVPTYPGSTETTAFSILKNYVRRRSQRAGVYVVHRLDRETSGLLVFAKSPELQQYMRTYWRQLVTKRTYVAVAEGIFDKPQGKITTWLTEDKRNAVVYSSPVDDGGQIAVTNYNVIKTTNNHNDLNDHNVLNDPNRLPLSLVELNLETGRTNQIRVHLASVGHPVLGDRKYGHGNEFSPADRLCLHARILEFIHPVTEQTVRFETPVPRDFTRLFTK